MIDIQQLRLHMPAGFENRAAIISRLVGQELSAHALTGDQQINSLSVRNVHVSIQQSNRQVARNIANAIAVEIQHQPSMSPARDSVSW